MTSHSDNFHGLKRCMLLSLSLALALLAPAIVAHGEGWRASFRSPTPVENAHGTNDMESPSMNGGERRLPFHEKPALLSMPSRDATMTRRAEQSDDYNASKSKSSDFASKFDECRDTCIFNHERKAMSSDKKSSCCKGGVSTLKMRYHGERGTLYGPDLSSVPKTNYNIDESCGNSNSHSSDNVVIARFASCQHCFPGGDSTCGTEANISNSVFVETGDEVCLFAWDDATDQPVFDAKLPINLDLYFFAEVDNFTTAIRTSLHTSCSNPVYPPYEASFATCSQDGYFDPSVDSQDLSSPVLEFQDGISAKYPDSLFSDCAEGGGSEHSSGDDDDDSCCKGGASFLKTRLGGDPFSGSITTNVTTALSLLTPNGSCDYEHAFNNGYSGSGKRKSKSKSRKPSHDASTTTVRFVPCTDGCLDPYSDQNCAVSYQSINVSQGEEICFGTWDSDTERISFGSKLPTNLPIFFISDDGSKLFHGYVHTSCSVSLHSPYAQTLTDHCSTESGPLVNLDEESPEDFPVYLEFVDGISKKYYLAATEYENQGASFFDISFSDCGCACDATSTSEAPSASPSEEPFASPTSLPAETDDPSASPTLSPTDTPTASPTASPTDTPASSSTPSPTDTPTASPTPSQTEPPTEEPSEEPTSLPNPGSRPEDTGEPTHEPSGGPTSLPEDDCAKECEEWLSTNCNIKGDVPGSILPGVPCDVNWTGAEDGDGFGEGRFLLSRLSALESEENSISLLSVEEQMKYHERMIILYEELLSHQ